MVRLYKQEDLTTKERQPDAAGIILIILGISDFYGFYIKDITLALLSLYKSFFNYINYIMAFY